MTKKNNSFKELNVNLATEIMMIHQVSKAEEAPRTRRRIEMETMEWSNPGSPILLWVRPLKRTSTKSSRTKSSYWESTISKAYYNQIYISKDYWWNTKTFTSNGLSELSRSNCTSRRYSSPRKSFKAWSYASKTGSIWTKAMSFSNKWRKNWKLWGWKFMMTISISWLIIIWIWISIKAQMKVCTSLLKHNMEYPYLNGFWPRIGKVSRRIRLPYSWEKSSELSKFVRKMGWYIVIYEQKTFW